MISQWAKPPVMAFSWIPFGYRKGWRFTINVKANVLKNVMKWDKHTDFRDNLEF